MEINNYTFHESHIEKQYIIIMKPWSIPLFHTREKLELRAMTQSITMK